MGFHYLIKTKKNIMMECTVCHPPCDHHAYHRIPHHKGPSPRKMNGGIHTYSGWPTPQEEQVSTLASRTVPLPFCVYMCMKE
jgi:hypothetical protein